MRLHGKYGGQDYLEPSPRQRVRLRRFDRRGLAEIVGTLMLVLIVVAAAVAFSLFVAAYEKQVLSVEAQTHARDLESARVTAISVCSYTTCPRLYTTTHLPLVVITAREYIVNVSFVSADVNSMSFVDYAINGFPVDGWLFYPANSVPVWMKNPSLDPSNWSACQAATSMGTYSVGPNASCSDVVPYGQVNVSLVMEDAITAPIHLSVYTGLADVLSYLFFPPVAIVKTTVLPVGSTSIPLFDGSASYEPPGGDNASIASYAWAITPSYWEVAGNITVDTLTHTQVNLSFDTVNPTAPEGPALGGTPIPDSGCSPGVCFRESNLTYDTIWSVYVTNTTENFSKEGTATVTPTSTSIGLSLPNGSYAYKAFVSAPSPFGYRGPQVEVEQLSTVPVNESVYWSVALTVTNTDGLTDSTNVTYET